MDVKAETSEPNVTENEVEAMDNLEVNEKASVPETKTVTIIDSKDNEKKEDGTERKMPERGASSFFRSISTKVFTSTNESDKKEKEEVAKQRRLVVQHKIKSLHDKSLSSAYWLRTTDATTGNIYYYNTMTAEMTWLAPCSVCGMPSEKWCIQCQTSYCQRHLIKKHQPPPPPPSEKNRNDKSKGMKINKSTSEDTHSLSSDPQSQPGMMLNHDWTDYELTSDLLPLTRPPLTSLQQEYCLECQYHIAEVICNHCWDCYCSTCFHKVHRVGSLKRHLPLPYHETKYQTWYVLQPGHYGNTANVEYYYHGERQEGTYEKPRELMTALEQQFYDSWKTFEKGSTELYEMIDQLQFEIEKAKYEKEKMLMEMHEMRETFKTRLNLTNTTGIDIEALFSGNQNNQSEYRQMLLNPSERKRGQARTKYIKDLLDLPFPT